MPPSKTKKKKSKPTKKSHKIRVGPGRGGFPPEFRARVLASLDSNGGCVRRTAAEWGLATTTVHQWATGRTPTDPGLRTEKKRELLSFIEDVVIRATLVDPRDKGFKDSAIGAGIYLDKMLLMNGQANQRTESRVETSEPVDIGRLSYEQLKQLWELQQVARGVPALREASDLAHEETVDDADDS